MAVTRSTVSLYSCDTQYSVTDIIAVYHYIEIRTDMWVEWRGNAKGQDHPVTCNC